MSWLWLALLDEPPGGARPLAAAAATAPGGAPAGVLAAWPAQARPPVRAAKVDARAIDPGGAPGRVSLVLAPPRCRLPFDDAAVQGARRAVLAGPPRRLVSTLVRGDSLFAGAITALPDGEPDGVVDDPFARLFPARRLRVAAGLLGAMPPPAGPVIERYGSGNPWPWDRFPASPATNTLGPGDRPDRGGGPMPKYVTFFTYTGEAWARMVADPANRAEAARAAIERAGGELEAFFWMLGPSDGFAVYSMPDEVTAAGLAAAVAGTGRVARLETYQVLDMEAGRRALELADEASRAYRPPGAPRDWREGYDQLG